MSVDIQAFWQKVQSSKGEMHLVKKALILFYVLCDGDIPMWVKTISSTALIYFINPWDPIGPDPLIFADDIAVLATALTSLSTHIKSHHKAQASSRMKQFN